MKRFIVFWKRDLINKFIVFVSLLVVVGGLAIVYLLVTLPVGKSLSSIFPQLDPLPAMTTPTAQAIKDTPQATITTMAFNIPWTPTNVSLDLLSSLTPEPPTSTFTSLPATFQLPSTTSTQLLITPKSTLTSTPVSPTSNPADIKCIPNNTPQIGKAVSVLDGNTINVLIDGLVYVVRYIGVAAPEDKILSEKARLENARLVFGKEITLIADQSDKDERGRLLRYVRVGDTFVNLKLIQQGLGSALDTPPDSACAQTFKQAGQSARSATPSSTPTP